MPQAKAEKPEAIVPPQSADDAFVYMLRCADGSLYTGWTNDLERRVAAHNAGTARRCTRARRPVELVYRERRLDRSDALRREAEIKKLSRADKLALIDGAADALPTSCTTELGSSGPLQIGKEENRK